MVSPLRATIQTLMLRALMVGTPTDHTDTWLRLALRNRIEVAAVVAPQMAHRFVLEPTSGRGVRERRG